MAEFRFNLIQHLGIAAGVHNEVKLAEPIDRNISRNRKISVGQAVQAMIVKAQGFSGRNLSLNTRHYENRPVGVLFREGLKARDLHDSSRRTALEVIYEYGFTELFSHLRTSSDEKDL